MKLNLRSVVLALVLGSVATGLVVYLFQRPSLAQPPKRRGLEQRIDNTVRERGAVESAQLVELRCEVVGGSTILSVVPEGSRVEKGDLLVELDDSALRDKLAEARILAEQAKAAVVRSQVELELVMRSGEGQQRVAQKGLHAAKLAFDNVLADDGEIAYELTATASEVTVAKARLQMANTLLTNAPGNRGAKSVPDLRLAIVEAEEAIRVAEARTKRLARLREYQKALLELSLTEKEIQLVRHKSDLETSLTTAKANIHAKEAALAREQQRLKQAEKQLALCKIYAPMDGVVLYATAAASRTARSSLIEEGVQVRERQPIVRLPNLTNLRVKVHVSESRIARVRPGQPAEIHIDAFPDKTFSGKVEFVNSSPEPSSWVNADVKEYAVLVSIDKPADSLKIGLTAMVEIDTSER